MAKKRLSKSSLHWFIRNRSYVTVPDLRRRFKLDESEEIVAIACPDGRAYIGLAPDVARIVQDLVREGKIGLELDPDLRAKVVRGIFFIPHPHDRDSTSPTEQPFDDVDNDDVENDDGALHQTSTAGQRSER